MTVFSRRRKASTLTGKAIITLQAHESATLEFDTPPPHLWHLPAAKPRILISGKPAHFIPQNEYYRIDY